MSGISAKVNLSDNHGEIVLFNNLPTVEGGFVIEDKRFFLKPVRVYSKPQRLTVDFQEDAVFLDSPDIALQIGKLSVQGRAALAVNYDLSFRALVDLHNAYIHATDLSAILPLKVVRGEAGKYIQTLLQSGQFVDNHFRINAYSNGQDRTIDYALDAHLEDALLQFHTAWPKAEHVSGLLHVANNQLTFDSYRAETLDNRVSSMKLTIDDLNKPILHADINTALELGNALNYIRHSPLNTWFGKTVAHLEGRGPMHFKSSFDLDMLNPFPMPEHMDGSLDLERDSLTYKKDWFIFDQVAGQLRFDSEKMWSDNIQAIFLDSPVQIQLQSDMNVAHLSMDGNLDIQPLVAPYVSVDWRDKIHGKSQMHVEVTNAIEKGKSVIDVDAHQVDPKVQLDFPEPLSITERDSIPMHFSAHYIDDVISHYHLAMREDTYLDWDVVANKQVFHTTAMDLDRWMDAAKMSYAENDASDEAPFVLDVKSLNYQGVTLHDAQLHIQQIHGRWHITVQSKEAAGKIVYRSGDRVSIVLDKLVMHDGHQQNLDVAALEGIDYHIDINHLVGNQYHADHVRLDLVRNETGFDINQFNAIYEGADIDLTGKIYTLNKPSLAIEGRLEER